jgi:hypothetical protein
MKRGISIALQAAGMVFACLATTLNHPIQAAGAATEYDTAYYYNERGTMIYRDPLVAQDKYYVIRTCKTKEQLYYDWYEQDSAKLAKGYDFAYVENIPVNEAQEVEQLISSGKVNDPLVRKNIVQIYSPGLIRKLYDTIPDSGKNKNRKRDFREYGGLVLIDKSFTFQQGKRGNPVNRPVAVYVKGHDQGVSYWHSHPSGEKQNGGYAYIQAPSGEDQRAIPGGIGYVFGMNKRSHLLYIISKNGIHATLPFCWFLCCSVNK